MFVLSLVQAAADSADGVLVSVLVDKVRRLPHRSRLKTKEKAKVVAAVWGGGGIYFFAALAILYQDDLKNRMSCTRTILRIG